MRRPRSPLALIAWTAAALAAAAGLSFAVARARAASEPAGQITRLSPTEIEFTATLTAGSFDNPLMMPGYHAVVWRGGRSAHAALLRADVTDIQVLDALEALGAKPGNGLGLASWDERHNAQSSAPDRVIAGPPVEVLVRLPGRAQPVPLGDLILDRGAPAGSRGVQLRFGGHRANIEAWRSGCIVCLYSCPGSKLGNARYTVRDYTRDPARFRARTDLLPKDGTKVAVIVRLLPPT